MDRPIYDLHSHTTASDGFLSPRELVFRAVEQKVTVLAITDHDSFSGLDEARQTIIQHNLPLQLVNGIEISTCWNNKDIHIVGLNVELENNELQQLVALQKKRRYERAVKIAQQLEKLKLTDVLAKTQHIAQNAEITRAHFARFLVDIGQVNSTNKAFSRYLGKDKIGHVASLWCSMKEAIMIIKRAGGTPVLAHPTRYNLSAKECRKLILAFAESEGEAIEVALCQQTSQQRAQLGRWATELHLLASVGSDFHRPCPWSELGRNLELPEDVMPIWSSWS